MIKLILNAHIFAPERLGICHLAIGGGKILSLSNEKPQLKGIEDLEIFDADGATLIPGFIDCHAHITGGGGESGPSSRVPALPLSHFTKAGVTSVIGLLGTDDLTRNTQTLVTQAYGLREQGLSAWCYTGGYHVPPMTLTGSVRSDIVNIDPVIAVGEIAISDHRSSQPTLDEILRLASDAHVAGLMTGKAGVLHLHLGDGARGLDLVRASLETSEIPARVFHPTHVNRNKKLFIEACDFAKKFGYIDITAFPKDDPLEDGYSAGDALMRYYDNELPADKITVSSDGGGCLPVFDGDGCVTAMGIGSPKTLLETFKELLDEKVDISQALLPFTQNVATLMRLSGKGKIAVGNDADFITLDDNHDIRDVMAMGEWHVKNKELVRRGTFE